MRKRVEESSLGYLGETEQRLQSQRVQAQAALKNALETQGHEKAVKAQDILARIAVEESSVKNSKMSYAQQVQETPAQPVVPQEQQKPSPKAQEWANQNDWFGEDRVMTMATFGIHEDLVDEGFDPDSDEYYTEVNKRLRKSFPAAFQTEETNVEIQKPQQRVASAARNTQATGGKRKVKLSPSEVQMAKKLNVPLNEYAKFVKR